MTSQNNQATIIVPAAVAELMTHAMGAPATAIAPTFGGFSNLSFFATFGEMRCVVKAATLPIKRADLRREATVLAALAGTGIPAPTLLHVIEDEHWTIAVTQARAGRNGMRVLAENPIELEPLFAALGATLAHVHAATPQPSADLLLTNRIAQAAEELPNMPIESELRAKLTASLLHPVWQTESPRLIHGDTGLHNVLWNGELLLLDWEWASVGTPLFDLAWLRWTLRWRDLDDALWRAAMRNYQQRAGEIPKIASDTSRALMLGQIAMILTRARAQPTPFTEWVRRAAWTLALADEQINF